MIAFSDSEFTWALFKIVTIIATTFVSLLVLAWVGVKRWPSK